MLSQIGVSGIIILIVVCLIAFGSKNLPEIAKAVGRSLNEFKEAVNPGQGNEYSEEFKRNTNETSIRDNGGINDGERD